MKKHKASSLYKHAADALCRARKLPVGPARNDLRQLALGLRWLEKRGFSAHVEDRLAGLARLESERGNDIAMSASALTG
ncbi:MAG: hypothetical protein JWQ24_6 [Tardiphaga sp.]|nr:hypothetical protein [Tardiphaga sp.]